MLFLFNIVNDFQELSYFLLNPPKWLYKKHVRWYFLDIRYHVKYICRLFKSWVLFFRVWCGFPCGGVTPVVRGSAISLMFALPPTGTVSHSLPKNRYIVHRSIR